MNGLRAAALLVALPLSGCSEAAEGPASEGATLVPCRAYLTAMELVGLSDVVVVRAEPLQSQAVFHEDLSRERAVEQVRARLPDASPELVECFVDSLASGEPFDAGLFAACGVDARIVTEEAVKETFRLGPDAGWQRFEEAHGATAYWALTRLAVDDAGREAILHTNHFCGGLCGSGAFVHLVREGDRWVVRKESTAWVS